jgi:hypothetical protein
MDGIGIPATFALDSKMQTLLQGQILHDCVSAIVEMAGASRATGRRLILVSTRLYTRLYTRKSYDLVCSFYV